MNYERDKRIFNGNKNSKVENKSNSVDKSTESVDMSIAEFEEYEENVLKKLNDYLSRTNRTEDDIHEIYHNYDIIVDNNGHDFNVDGLSKIEEFVDNSNDKALYNISYIKEFMSDLASDYSNNLPGWGTEEESEDLEEESEDLEEESEDLEDLEDEEIEEIFERDNKKEKKPSKIATLFKKIFTKKDDTELEDEEIEEVRERKKFSLKSLFGKKRKNKNVKEVKVGNEKNFEELSLHEKLFKYLDGVDYTWKDLSNIISKISVISEDETKTEELHKFLNENKDLSKEEKISKLIYKIIELSSPVIKNESKEIINPKAEVIKKFFGENGFDTNSELIKLYNEIVMNDENIDKLYNYIANNIEEAKNADNIISKMNEILGKKLNIEDKTKNKKESKTIGFVGNSTSIEKEDNKVIINKYLEQITLFEHEIELQKEELNELYKEIAKNHKKEYKGSEDESKEEKRAKRFQKATKEELVKYNNKLQKISEISMGVNLLKTKVNALRKFEEKKISEAIDSKYEKRDSINSKTLSDIVVLEHEVELQKEELNELYKEIAKNHKKEYKGSEDESKEEKRAKRFQKATKEELVKYNNKLKEVKELELKLSVLKNREKVLHKAKQEEYKALFI